MAEDTSATTPHNDEPVRNGLERWRADQPVGIAALGSPGDAGIGARLAGDPSVTRWWIAHSETLVVGPATKAPFDTMVFFETADPASALRLTGEICNRPEERWTILAGRPAPARFRFFMDASRAVLSRLPAPRAPQRDLHGFSSDKLGTVNPSLQQLRAFDEYSAQAPVLVLNLNHHIKQGTHPDTGETMSGIDLANLYLKRGMRTFSRLGARVLWAGGCKSVIRDDYGLGPCDQIGLIHYSRREDYEKLLRIGLAEGWDRFREAGFDNSWNVHCRITASSEPRDIAPVGPAD